MLLMDSAKKKKYLIIGAVFLTGLCLGIIPGYMLYMQGMASNDNLSEVRINSQQFRFTNPLLYYKSNPDQSLNPLKDTFSAYVTPAKNRGDASSISVYYRDMNTGEWTGLDETVNYEPASMLKVVLMIAYLKQSVENPGVLTQKIPYTPTNNVEEAYRAADVVPAGSYSVSDLLAMMIRYSDNDALTALSKDDNGHTAEVFRLFQLPTPPLNTTDYMSARTYSRVFRVLYDSTYLPWEQSEAALELLSQTDFKLGLVAGVPPGTIIAHKFGERTNRASDGTIVDRELHDCGIVYKPAKPYFLCVMTRGADFPKLQKIIADISAITYSAN
jgi:beta-lactamase class A